MAKGGGGGGGELTEHVYDRAQAILCAQNVDVHGKNTIFVTFVDCTINKRER